jgi:DNA-directed RNA polymerase subunit M/transcription elongation factor TFIIS
METFDPAGGEFFRLSERYRRMSDDELIALARRTSELTNPAQQALAVEVSQRRLKVQLEEQQEEQRASPVPERPADSVEVDDPAYAEERELVEICTVWSWADALQVQTLLDTAGIPFYMGCEKATGVDTVTSNFADGVSVQVMRVGEPWARQAMEHYTPRDAPAEVEEEAAADLAVRCPKCRSTEVVFDRLVNEPGDAGGKAVAKYLWTCDSCGHEWEDDGIETETG